MDTLNGLVGGIIGEAGGQLLSAGFKSVLNFKTLIGRAASYTVNEVADTSLSTVLKTALKQTFPSALVSNVYGALYEIDPFPESAGLSDAPTSTTPSGAPSALTSTSSESSLAAPNSSSQKPSRLSGQSSVVRHASLMRDPIRPFLSPGQFTLSGSLGPQQSVSSTAFGGGGLGAPDPPARILNRQFKCSFGPAGASQGKRQTTGDGGLEALESRRRMYNALRARIRRLQPCSG